MSGSGNDADKQQDGEHRHPHAEHAPDKVHGLLQGNQRAFELIGIAVTGGVAGQNHAAGGSFQS